MAKRGKSEITAAIEAAGEKRSEAVMIRPLNLAVVELEIEGDAPHVQHAFGEKARKEIMEKQSLGDQAVGRRKPRAAKDFDKQCQEALHVSTAGWNGIPAAALRKAMISACKLPGAEISMTMAKLCIFIEADGYDKKDGMPLVKMINAKWKRVDSPVRIDRGKTIDIHARPHFAPGWRAKVRIKFDADVFSVDSIVNLLHRAGQQCGIGEGRNDSKDSAGCGWGSFFVRAKTTSKKKGRAA